MPETYDEEAVQQILRLAMMKQGQEGPMLRSQLVEIAEELGISEASLSAAEEEWQVQTEEQQARQEFAVYRHHQLRQGIVRFIIINSFLVMLNVITTHRIDWVVYPVVIWGMAIALQAWEVMQCEGESYNRAFRRWRLRQQIDQSFKAISERFRLTWSQVKTSAKVSQTFSGTRPSPSGKGAPSDAASSPTDANSVPANGSGTPSAYSGASASMHTLPKKAGLESDYPDHTSTESKSRLQNRIGDRLSHQNRVGNSSNGLAKGRDSDSADHLPG